MLSSCSNPKQITWYDLSKVKFEDKYFQENEPPFSYPVFSESVKSLDGEMVEISGYFLHMRPSKNLYLLSKGHLASCFFCGVGGPETVLELQFNSRQKFKTDNLVSVTGILKLNSKNDGHFMTDCKVTLLD
jgi:hypothetical protein